MNILLTNDDGYQANGINILFEYLLKKGHNVFMIAPEKDNSAISHSITLGKELYLYKKNERIFYINGTPSDCVMLGLKSKLLPRIELLISGINRGGNMGEDVHYSGTVAAAFEGAFFDIPSIAISINSKKPTNYEAILPFIEKIIDFRRKISAQTVLNVNYKDIPKLKEIKWTYLGTRKYIDNVEFIKETDSRIRIINNYAENIPTIEEGSDFWASENGYVSITPISIDWTDRNVLKKIYDEK